MNVVLIYGSRAGAPKNRGGLSERSWFAAVLRAWIKRSGGIELVAHGGYKGIDTFADEWAAANERPALRVPAKWSVLKNAAGPDRNRRMWDWFCAIAPGERRHVLGLPGGRGTAHMQSIAASGQQRGELPEGHLWTLADAGGRWEWRQS